MNHRADLTKAYNLLTHIPNMFSVANLSICAMHSILRWMPLQLGMPLVWLSRVWLRRYYCRNFCIFYLRFVSSSFVCNEYLVNLHKIIKNIFLGPCLYFYFTTHNQTIPIKSIIYNSIAMTFKKHMHPGGIRTRVFRFWGGCVVDCAMPPQHNCFVFPKNPYTLAGFEPGCSVPQLDAMTTEPSLQGVVMLCFLPDRESSNKLCTMCACVL
jgi:hypothetical protein